MCGKTEGRGGEGTDCLHHLRRRVCLHHAAVVVQKPSVGIEIDTIHDRIRVDPYATTETQHNFHLISDPKLSRGGPDPHWLSNRVNAGRIGRFESFCLRDLERGSK